MKCEYCGKEHDGHYGIGKFCSHSCQASFINKKRGKRTEETRKKISESLHKRRKLLTCIICGKQFYFKEGYNTSRKFCSEDCHNKYFKNVKKYVNYNIIIEKMTKSKSKKYTFNKSKAEELIYKKLYEKYPNIKRQYYSDLYPFACDFYLPDKDLYIEYNGLWTHGTHPYTGNKEDLNIVNEWKSKNSDYYNNAIYTWTDLDVRKRNLAKKNNLNYVEIWKIDEIDKLL